MNVQSANAPVGGFADALTRDGKRNFDRRIGVPAFSKEETLPLIARSAHSTVYHEERSDNFRNLIPCTFH